MDNGRSGQEFTAQYHRCLVKFTLSLLMCLATHEWQAMTFYKGQAAAWEGCMAATSVGGYGLFAGGFYSNVHYSTVDAYAVV